MGIEGCGPSSGSNTMILNEAGLLPGFHLLAEKYSGRDLAEGSRPPSQSPSLLLQMQ